MILPNSGVAKKNWWLLQSLLPQNSGFNSTQRLNLKKVKNSNNLLSYTEMLWAEDILLYIIS